MTESKECTPAFRQLIKLATVGATGKKTEIASVDWQSVLRFAQEQSVVPLVSCALLVQTEITLPDSLREQLLEMARVQSGTNFVRKIRIFRLIREMEDAGIDVMLLKGYAVGRCYAYPDCRDSADTDLLITKEQEMQVYDFLRNKGFYVDPRGETEHHAVCQHPKFGMVETHVQLYAELIQNVWFQDARKEKLIREKSIRIQSEEVSYSSLGYTDHLIFLTLHLIKHFIHDGLGLRMMLDIALFYKTYKDEIDFTRYWALLEELHYNQVVCGILWALIDTGCFGAGDFPGIQPVDKRCIDLLLYDLEISGHMGVKLEELARRDIYYEYSRRVILREKSPMQYRLYMIGYKIRAAKKQFFPDRETLTRLYPETKQHEWIMPFAQIHRVLNYPIQRIKAGSLKQQIRSDSAEMPEEANRRMELLKVLEII